MSEAPFAERGRWTDLPTRRAAAALVALVPFVVVMYATRRDPMMSPDSMHYLAVADHLRRWKGITDLTGLPMTVFPPVFPLLLVPGGTSLLWARLVGAAAVAVASVCLFAAVRRRASTTTGVVAALALGLSAGLVRVGSTVWSENPFLAISAAMLLVLGHPRLTDRRLVGGGLLAAAGFLTRYAGAGLAVAGLVMVLLATWRTPRRWRSLTLWCAGAATPVVLWLVRNLVATGQPLGPRFEGGAPNPVAQLIEITRDAIGELLVPRSATSTKSAVGVGVIAGLVVVSLWLVVRLVLRRRVDVVDAGVAVFGLTCVVMPIVARMLTSNDIEYRVMSPTMLAVVYFVTLGGWLVRRRVMWRPLRAVGAAVVCVVLAVWVGAGFRWAERTPSLLFGSAGNRNQFSAELHDAIDTLPADALVLTNSPHRVWWFNRRDPTTFAFARPRPGNSVYPISPADTVADACTGRAYLAWFTGLRNAGNRPEIIRPDLAKLIELIPEQSFTGGTLYRLAVDPGRCPPTAGQ